MLCSNLPFRFKEISVKRATKLFSAVLFLSVLFSCATISFAEDGAETPAAVEIKVVAKKFKFEPGKITVRKGEQVRLVVTSVDVDHGIAIREYGVEKEVKKGATEVIEFSADKEGKFKIICSVFCGEGHPEMTGELVVTAAQTESSAYMKVRFDPDKPGIVFVESNGDMIRIDTNAKTFTRADGSNPAISDSVSKNDTATPIPATVTQDGNKPQRISDDYDYQLVNVPTPKRVPKGSLNVHFSHRFSSAINAEGSDFGDTANELFGLDSFSVSALGFSYGFTDRLYGKVSRSPVCDRLFLCKTVEFGLGYHFLDEAGKSPVALSAYTSIEGDDNFTENYNYNVQVMLARSITRYVNVFFSPAVHFRANDNHRFNPDLSNLPGNRQVVGDLDLGKHTGSFGFGVNAKIRPSASLLFEFTPRTGFKLGNVVADFSNPNEVRFTNNSEPEIGFGIEKRMGRHAFALTFSNTQTTTTSRYNSSNLGLKPSRFTIGFNIFRRLK
jgi:cytochrome c oxidase subunit II